MGTNPALNPDHHGSPIDDYCPHGGLGRLPIAALSPPVFSFPWQHPHWHSSSSPLLTRPHACFHVKVTTLNSKGDFTPTWGQQGPLSLVPLAKKKGLFLGAKVPMSPAAMSALSLLAPFCSFVTGADLRAPLVEEKENEKDFLPHFMFTEASFPGPLARKWVFVLGLLPYIPAVQFREMFFLPSSQCQEREEEQESHKNRSQYG